MTSARYWRWRCGSQLKWPTENFESALPSVRNDSNANGTEAFAITSGYDPEGTGAVDVPARAGDITITVRGMALRNNVLVATTTISRTFEVLPKCCWGSLGGYGNAFGPDSRPCPSIGFGIVAGAAENSTGSIEVSGAAADIVTGTGENVPFVYCIATSTCSVNVNQNLGTGVKVVDVDMPAMPQAANTTCLDNATEECTIKLEGDLTLDTGMPVADWPGKFAQLCSRNTSSPPLTTCSINRLDFGANKRTLTVDSRGGPLHIYFPNAQSGSTKTLDQRNNGGFKHVINGTQLPARITDFSLFGCQPSPTRSCTPEQIIDIGNGGSDALRLFVYFPNGSITLGGNAAFEGVAWVNKLGANGNIRYVIPASGLSDVLTTMGMGGANPRQRFPLVDYVTRATKSLRFF